MALGEIAFRVCAGRVEIAQHGDAQAFRRARICMDLLAGELGAPIRVDRALRRVFCNRQHLGDALRLRTSSRTTIVRTPMAQHGLDHI
jgi:hypothetical protein